MSTPNESFVQLATDGSGKRMRNVVRYVQQSDGTTTPVYEEVVQIAGPSGDPVDFSEEFGKLNDTLERMTPPLTPSLDVAPILASGGQLPVKAAPFNPVKLLGDSFGRQIMLNVASRDMLVTQTTTISASTSETTVLTAAPGIYLDVFLMIISNTSAATSTRIDVRDTTTGSILFSLQSVGGAAPIGFSLPIPIPQTKQGTNWTMQCATSTTDIRVYMVAVRNQ